MNFLKKERFLKIYVKLAEMRFFKNQEEFNRVKHETKRELELLQENLNKNLKFYYEKQVNYI